MEKQKIRLQFKTISKWFPGVKALDGVDFDLRVGEVHALCGENGAGKTTLMNILSGNLQPDQGQILLNDQPVVIASPLEAQRLGIGIVYQEKSLVGNLPVADNIFAGNQPLNRWGLIDRRRLHKQTEQLLARLGMQDLGSHVRVDQLTTGKQQMVEIAKALSRDPDILILDEPTAAISEQDTRVLFGIVRLMAGQGKSIIYISHRMGEIFEVADRVTVLKDGKYQGTRYPGDTHIDEIIRLMVGRDLKEFAYKNLTGTDQVLSVVNFSGRQFRNISFDLYKSEILGFSGLVGAGRSEIAQAIFGAIRKTSGKLILNSKEVSIRHPGDAIRAGIGYLPENRKEQGLFLDMTVEENLLSALLNNDPESVFLQVKGNQDLSKKFINKLDIRTPDSRQKVINLSGGNQQKIVLAKWLTLDPGILMVDEPTAGIDVGAKSAIYGILNDLTVEGTSIILISSDLQELLGICDRILVFCSGRITADLKRDQFSEEEIMHFSSGTKDMFKQEMIN